MSESEQPPQSSEKPAPETKGHEPPVVEPAREYGHEPPARLQEGHQAPEERGHQPPEGHIELGHPPPENVVVVQQQVGEMHSPAVEAPEPTEAPSKPPDAAQSVTPPQAHQEAPAHDDSGSHGGNN